MKKILFTANTDRHILLCHIPYLKWLKENGYTIHLATNTDKEIPYVDKKINLEFTRNPFSIKNIKAIFKLKKIIKTEKYDVIHTHTPVGSVVTRISYKLSKIKSKLIYTCHGFHFFKGAPMHYWLMFYPIEKYLMKYTDILIVMNDEDYEFSKKHFKNTKIKQVKGVGFNLQKLETKVNEDEVRRIYRSFKLKKDDYIVTYVAELSKRKKQMHLVQILNKSNIRETNIKVLLVGDDNTKGKVQKKIKKYKLENNVIATGFRNDVQNFLAISNLVISVSSQEGLPLNVMEAIFKKKFIVASNCRGNIDLVENGRNGYIIENINEIWDKIVECKAHEQDINKNYDRAIDINEYSIEKVLPKVIKFYK